MAVTPTASSAFCSDEAVVGGHICHNDTAFVFSDDGTLRHSYNKVFGFFTVTSAALSVRTIGCFIFSFILKIVKGRKVCINHKNNVSAFTAVSAVRTARGDVLFTVESNCTVTAVTGFDFNDRFVNKHWSASFFTHTLA